MHHDLDDNDDDGDDDDDHWRKLIPKYIFQLRFPILECTFPNIGKWSQEEKNPNFVSDLSNFVPVNDSTVSKSNLQPMQVVKERLLLKLMFSLRHCPKGRGCFFVIVPQIGMFYLKFHPYRHNHQQSYSQFSLFHCYLDLVAFDAREERPTCLDLGEGVSANSVSDQECYFLVNMPKKNSCLRWFLFVCLLVDWHFDYLQIALWMDLLNFIWCRK